MTDVDEMKEKENAAAVKMDACLVKVISAAIFRKRLSETNIGGSSRCCGQNKSNGCLR